MPRPTLTTPVETTSTIVQSIANWTREYADALATIFGDDWDGPALADEIADTLDADQQAYVRETREDVGMTNKRDEAVAGTQRLVASAASMAELAFEDDPNVRDIVTDFAPVPPSRVRSPNAAQTALTRIQAALEIHGEAMKQKLSHIDAFEQQVTDTVEQLDDVLGRHATETQQTKAARRKRDASRERAVNFVRRQQLAAESVDFMQPEALEALHAIFDAHMPTHRPSVTDEDLSEDADTPSQPQTPTGDDQRDDGTDREDVDEPIEA